MAFDLGVFGAQPVRRWGQLTSPPALRQWPAQAPAHPMPPAWPTQSAMGAPPPGRKGGFGDLMDSVQVQPSGTYGNPDRFNGNNTVRNGAPQAFASMGERGGADPRAVIDHPNDPLGTPLPQDGGIVPRETYGNPDLRGNGQGGGRGGVPIVAHGLNEPPPPRPFDLREFTHYNNSRVNNGLPPVSMAEFEMMLRQPGFDPYGGMGGGDPRVIGADPRAVIDHPNDPLGTPLPQDGGIVPRETYGNPDLRGNGDNTVRQGGGIGNMAGGVRRFNITSQPRRSSMIYTGR